MKRSLETYTTRSLIVARWMDGLPSAYQLMNQHNLRHLPVIDEQQKIIGIVSDRDFQRAMRLDPNDLAYSMDRGNLPNFPADLKVRDVMSWPVEAIEESGSLADAARMMIDRKISALLVTRDQDVVGIVTTEDLLRALVADSHTGIQGFGHDLQAALYNSPVGQIASNLANVGV